MAEKGFVLILDASAFIMGYDPLSVSYPQFSVPSVLNELLPETTEWLRCSVAEQSGKLKIQQPSEKSVEKIKFLSASVGDIRTLSDTDIQILSLAFELQSEGKDPVIVSDDYAIQNVAERIGLKYKSLATFGIRYQFDWILYCPACHRKYPSGYIGESCGVCGTALKRKPLKKAKIEKT